MPKFAFVSLALASAALSQAAWTTFGGHYYEVLTFSANATDHSWSAANALAQAQIAPSGAKGYLACITSASENAFVYSLVSDGLGSASPYWAIDGAGNDEGPYLGGFRAAGTSGVSSDYQWVTGEAFSYTAWNPGEPNNSGGAENRICLFANGNAQSSNWNDCGDIAIAGQKAYLVEAVPEPSAFVALGLGVVAVLRRRRR